MVIVTNNWRIWALGMLASLAIFGVLYFTVIQPDNNAANQAIKTGLQQSQQALNQAQTQLTSAASQAPADAGQGKQALTTAAKLTACIAAAGTDPTKLAACHS